MSSSSSSSSSSLSLSSGHVSLQGLRPSMEDEVCMVDHFPLPFVSSHLFGPISFFGVFDGHGGVSAARFTRDHLWSNLLAELQKSSNHSVEECLRQAYLITDQQFCDSINKAAEEKEREKASTATDGTVTSAPPRSRFSDGFSQSERLRDSSGTTAVACLIDHSSLTIWMANCGDSRGIIVHRGGLITALTRDHKADRPDEVERIRKAGGFVVQRRVMGELAISRAIGDLDFKEKGFSFVLADPEIEKRSLTTEECFIVLACDGLFDVMSNEQVGKYVWEAGAKGLSDQEISEKIVRHAIETLYTRDNVTTIVIRLRPIDFSIPLSIAASSGDADKFSVVESPTKPVKKLTSRYSSAEEPLELTVHNEPDNEEIELPVESTDSAAESKSAEVHSVAAIEPEETLEAVEVDLS